MRIVEGVELRCLYEGGGIGWDGFCAISGWLSTLWRSGSGAGDGVVVGGWRI